MNLELKQDFVKVYQENLSAPFFGGFRNWAEANIILPPAYSIPGKLDLGISPYLLKPMQAIDDPRIMQINLPAATQTGKTLLSELYIPYSIINNPGPIFRIFHNKDVSDVFAETRLIPLLKNCPAIKPLIQDRFATKKSGILLGHMAVTMGGSNTALQHGMSVKHLLCDELHEWQPGQFNKFLARTTAFAGRRKVICSSQPNTVGSEWDTICNKGLVYEWQWTCPACGKVQPFHWSYQRNDGTFAGFNWDTILSKDGSTNIAASAKTCALECIDCRERLTDTPQNRRLLNDTGQYILTKTDGDSSIVTFSWPNFVNINLSFESSAAQYMVAKKFKKESGLDEQLEIFVTQILGKFYRKEQSADLSQVLVELYDKENLDKDWLTVMGVDFQRAGKIKYYVIRTFNKKGTESRRLDFGIARTWDEIEALRVKHKITLPMAHVDSGDGETVDEVYQTCLRNGKVVDLKDINGRAYKKYVSWTPTKGDQKANYKHKDGITRLYSEESPQDAKFPQGDKLRGIPAPLILFSNFSLKTILMNMRDNKLEGITWKIDRADEEYDKQLFSEGLVDVLDKKTGLVTKRWIQHIKENHFLDCEVLCLLGAIRGGAFSATTINEEEIKKILASQENRA